jgi:hypothetical protein
MSNRTTNTFSNSRGLFFYVVFVRFCLRIKQPTPDVETNTPVYATSSIPVPAPTGPITVDVGNVTPSFDKPNHGTIKLPDGKIWCLSFFFSTSFVTISFTGQSIQVVALDKDRRAVRLLQTPEGTLGVETDGETTTTTTTLSAATSLLFLFARERPVACRRVILSQFDDGESVLFEFSNEFAADESLDEISQQQPQQQRRRSAGGAVTLLGQTSDVYEGFFLCFI